ncbi:MAG: hypothetical protein ACR2NZ_04100 [Rubripirellula sp.]
MNINPSAAASIAGTSRAAARGGEADGQAIESSRQQSTAEKPGGKSAQSSEIDAGDQTGDRGGNGRQVLDRFGDNDEREGESTDDLPTPSPEKNGPGQHLDLEA